MRRAEWVFGVEYGEDYEKVKAVLERIIAADERIPTTPAPFIGLGALSASSVDIKVRVWTKTENYTKGKSFSGSFFISIKKMIYLRSAFKRSAIALANSLACA